MRPKSLAVVIPCREPSRALVACLGSVTQQWPTDVQAEIVVVDDGSHLDYTLLTELWSPRVTLERLPIASGAGQARNYGVAATASEWVIFLDDDCTVPWGWTNSVLNFIEQHPHVSMVGGQIKSKRPQNWLSQATEDYILQSKLTKGGDPRVVTACAVVRRGPFTEVGGFHPRFTGAGGEDWDLSQRLGEAGFTLSIRGDFFCYHANPRRPGAFFKRAWRYGQTSLLLVPTPQKRSSQVKGRRWVLRPLKLARAIPEWLRANPPVSNVSWIRSHRSRFLYACFLLTYFFARWTSRQSRV